MWRVTCGGKRIGATNTVTDHGGKYQGHKFVLYLEHQGMVQCFTAHDTPQHNGIAKQLNHMILERVCALLHGSGLLKYLWGKAACHAVWLKNWTPTKVLDGLTPFKVAFGTKPNLSRIHEWGSKVFVRVKGISKLSSHMEQCQWMGIDDKSENACHVYWPAKQSITIKCNVSWQPTHHVLKGEHDYTQVPNVMIVMLGPSWVEHRLES